MNAPGKSRKSAFATNRKARHNYIIEDTFEAGIALEGAEVKSIREARVSLDASFAQIETGQVWLHDMHIQPYMHSRNDDYDPMHPRRLLLHKKEIQRLQGLLAQRGFTLVPLKLYSRHGFIKVKLGLAKGKQAPDKRDTLRKRTADREAHRAISDARKR